jgi:exopolyphosphatase / guanosine-5'-triphosphate,3'-diphosphate pyrophosphatase
LRIAVVDIGTNSTRLLVADVENGTLNEVARESRVTRMGRGVDLSGQLATEAIEEVCNTVADYISLYGELGAERVAAIATSAVRDARNADAFMAELRERFALESRILDGDEESRLTYAGACTACSPDVRTLVVDIGGGSTELVVGAGPEVRFHTSIQAGTVRHTERHLTADPPAPAELEDLASDVRGLIDAELAQRALVSASHGIAVAGTATSLAAIDLELDPYDPDAVHGHRLGIEDIQHMLSTLACVALEQRRKTTGLHPDRAPTIVAGTVILIQVMRAFGLRETEISEHDILHGAALEAAKAPA